MRSTIEFIIFVVAIALGYALYDTREQVATLRGREVELTAALNAAQAVRAADRAADASKAKATVLTQKRKEKVDADVKEAVRQNPEWAAAPVPVDIINSLH